MLRFSKSALVGSLLSNRHVQILCNLEAFVAPNLLKLHAVQLYRQLVSILTSMCAWTSMVDRGEESMEVTISKIQLAAEALLEPIYKLADRAMPSPWEVSRPTSVTKDISIVMAATAELGKSVAAFIDAYVAVDDPDASTLEGIVVVRAADRMYLANARAALAVEAANKKICAAEADAAEAAALIAATAAADMVSMELSVELSEAQVFGVEAAAYRSAPTLVESSLHAVAASGLRGSSHLIMAQTITLDSVAEWSEARLTGTGSAALPKAAQLQESAVESLHVEPMSGKPLGPLGTFEAPADWLEANISRTEPAALRKAAQLREAAMKSTHINPQRARRVAQMITLESAVERSEAKLSDTPAAASPKAHTPYSESCY